MLDLQPSTKVFVCATPVDMRWSFDALSGTVNTHFGKSPLSGHLFVFFSKRKNRMKILFWDSDGFALYYKRLERGTFAWILDLALDDEGEIEASAFSLILAGINPSANTSRNVKKRKLAPPTAPLQLV